MARGRMISTTTAGDKNFNALSTDTCRLAFVLLVPFADREGRTYGDPAMVRSMIFPRREDVTIEMVEGFIREWEVAGMIVWYEAKGDRFIWFPNFDRHQPGMRKEREPESEIPAPPEDVLPQPARKTAEIPSDDNPKAGDERPENIRQSAGNLPEDIRQTSGNHPEESRIKGMEWNGIKENGMESESTPDPFSLMQRAIEEITGLPASPSAIPVIEEIVAMGAIKDDIQEGYNWLKSQKKIVKYYGTLIGPTRTAMARRVGKPLNPVTPKPVTKEDLLRSSTL